MAIQPEGNLATHIHLSFPNGVNLGRSTEPTEAMPSEPNIEGLVRPLSLQTLAQSVVAVDVYTGKKENPLELFFIPIAAERRQLLEETLLEAEKIIAGKTFRTPKQLSALAGKIETCLGDSLILGPLALLAYPPDED
jgi:hypothetical protein